MFFLLFEHSKLNGKALIVSVQGMQTGWESDSSVSVVPASHLKTRDGTRAWPGGVFADNILQESSRNPNMAKA